MTSASSDITIIGAGLTGLTLAYLLRHTGHSIDIIEARDRIGGRILTVQNPEQATQEMGATWLGKKHTTLSHLLADLQIGTFEQKLGKHAIYEPISTSPPQLVTLPPNTDPSYRIQEGTFNLINQLWKLIEGKLHLNQPVKRIVQKEGTISVQTGKQEFLSRYVISTLPPFLFVKTIEVEPALPVEISKIANQTHTWMGESIKVGLNYATPFWRAENSSGTIFSNVGPIPEMYDHASFEDTTFGLKGFLNGAYFSITKAERRELVLGQLEKYYGKKVHDYLSYEETVWRNEPYTFVAYDNHILPHQNNGHSIYRQTFFNGKMFIAGAETAAEFPGYMEGAVRSAQYVAQRIEAELERP